MLWVLLLVVSVGAEAPSSTVEDDHRYYTLSVYQNNEDNSFTDNFINMENAEVKEGESIVTFYHSDNMIGTNYKTDNIYSLKNDIKINIPGFFGGRGGVGTHALPPSISFFLLQSYLSVSYLSQMWQKVQKDPWSFRVFLGLPVIY